MQQVLERIRVPEEQPIHDPSLVLDLPLYELDGASFMSKDTYGHLCTVTNTLWRLDGRHFAGADFINCGTGPSLAPSNALTIEGWFYIDPAGGMAIVPCHMRIAPEGTLAPTPGGMSSQYALTGVGIYFL